MSSADVDDLLAEMEDEDFAPKAKAAAKPPAKSQAGAKSGGTDIDDLLAETGGGGGGGSQGRERQQASSSTPSRSGRYRPRFCPHHFCIHHPLESRQQCSSRTQQSVKH